MVVRVQRYSTFPFPRICCLRRTASACLATRPSRPVFVFAIGPEPCALVSVVVPSRWGFRVRYIIRVGYWHTTHTSTLPIWLYVYRGILLFLCALRASGFVVCDARLSRASQQTDSLHSVQRSAFSSARVRPHDFSTMPRKDTGAAPTPIVIWRAEEEATG